MITFKLATVDDIPHINTLARAIFIPTYESILAPEQLEYMFEMMYSIANIKSQILEQGHEYFLAYNNENECIGYISMQQQQENLFHLQKIYILPSHQGKGYGKNLINFAIDYTKERCKGPVATMELNVNRSNKALDFYKHMGFRVARTGDYDIGGGYYMNDHIMAIDVISDRI